MSVEDMMIEAEQARIMGSFEVQSDYVDYSCCGGDVETIYELVCEPCQMVVVDRYDMENITLQSMIEKATSHSEAKHCG